VLKPQPRQPLVKGVCGSFRSLSGPGLANTLNKKIPITMASMIVMSRLLPRRPACCSSLSELDAEAVKLQFVEGGSSFGTGRLGGMNANMRAL
jgi:hypothetical protein